MKVIIGRGLLVIGLFGAAIVLGSWSGIGLCNWLVTSAESEVSLKISTRASNGDGAVEAVAGTTSLHGARSKGWIADVWSGPRRTGAFKVASVAPDGRIEARGIDADGARRGFGETIRRALRKRGKAPLDERYARRAENPFDTPEARRLHGSGGEDDGPTIYAGDVYISGIPMIDQGRRAYCAVASAARVLQGYGIEVTMEDLAALAHSSETCGTNQRQWENAIRNVANSHGLELKIIPELTETMTPLSSLLYDYNQMARDMDFPELYTWDYVNAYEMDYRAFDEDRLYDVQREVMLNSDRKIDAFDENVVSRIDDSDPILWTVQLGNVAEEVPHSNDTYLSADRGSHMRLIIGYNEDRGEVLYSDSWGEGHELKRMDAADALSITTAMYYLD